MSGTWHEAVGPFLDTAGLTRWAGVSEERLDELRETNQIIALPAADGSTLFPSFQFDRDGHPLPHLAQIWPVLARAYQPWAAATWLNTPLTKWGDRSAVDVLRNGTDTQVQAVLLEARHDATGMSEQKRRNATSERYGDGAPS